MNIALISDIHANYAALKSVLETIKSYSVDALIIAGDICGYYPDVNEVINDIFSLTIPIYCVVGNHDLPIIKKDIPNYLPYRHILESNLNAITTNNLKKLSDLAITTTFTINKMKFFLTHGTPTDNLNGRLYPDKTPDLSWFDNEIDIFILGHTHYPAIWFSPDKKIIINPGSVGQPRDGYPAPSWALMNTSTKSLTFNRTDYDREEYYRYLSKLNWDTRAISALYKKSKGDINIWG